MNEGDRKTESAARTAKVSEKAALLEIGERMAGGHPTACILYSDQAESRSQRVLDGGSRSREMGSFPA